MNLMSIITAIITFVRYIPELIKIWKEISALLGEIQDKKEAKDKAKEIADAIRTAKETKDTSSLEDLFGPKGFDVKFKVEEKKSLKTVALAAPSNLDISFTTPGNKLEVMSFDAPIDAPIDAPVVEPSLSDDMDNISSNESFSFMGRISGDLPGSFVNRTTIGTGPRMGSTFFLLLISFHLLGCKTQVVNQPTWKPKVYAGDSLQGGITRKQSGEFIRATDKKFDEYMAVSYSDYSCLVQTYVYNCKEYKKPVVKCDARFTEYLKDEALSF